MADSKQGRFITLEGIEGVGKSTNMELVSSLIEAAGKDVVVTREPGGTELGERIREVVLMHSADVIPTSAELLLMFAARAIHIENKIAPALTRGDWVVCDRFTDATYAYQGGGRGADLDLIETLEQSVQDDPHRAPKIATACGTGPFPRGLVETARPRERRARLGGQPLARLAPGPHGGGGRRR